MPYIQKSDRKNLDSLIDKLAEQIVKQSKEHDDDAAFAGLLNYACSRLALKIVRLRFGKMRYWLIAVLTGVFKNVGDEFYRRIATEYEDLQIKKNGDVDLYRDYSKEINNK